jgi:hypothetical protein
MEKLILTEYYTLDIDDQIIKEAAESNSPLILKDKILQKSGVKNANGRIYPANLLMREMKKYSELVNERRALGELDHPDSPVVELKSVSHIVTEIHDDDGVIRGDIEILNTPQGDILRNLIKQRIKIGISSRGIGSLQKEGDTDIVQDDFELIAFDAVSTPSTPGAYLVNESKVPTDVYSGLRNIVYEILGDKYFL